MAKSDQKTGEADFKVGVFQEYFGIKKFTYRQEIDRIDFIITDNTDRHLIWAETKKNTADIVEMFVQLILTIGKGRTFDKYNPPPFLCVFDYKKIAFLQYNIVQDIFYQTDFNWNIAPSDHKSKEFKQIKNIVEKTVNEKNLIFSFDSDKALLKDFIKSNFHSQLDLFPDLFSRLQIDKNNFIPTYNRWLEMVKPSIAIDWDIAKRKGIIDGDFYLADLLSEDNVTLKDKLFVLLKKTNYELDRQIDDMGLFTSKSVSFKDNGLSHKHFWEIYIRPPKEEYWEYIIKRRDLLVPQDIRERKGSFFTPQIWVQKSQEYLSMALGENWQEEYHVWDCAAGTGNLLVGLTNKYNLWASTLDRQDVDVMNDRIKNGANLLESHVFQFDFLNDSFDKLPEGLKEIVNDPIKREKLVIYINPPYAEATSSTTISGSGQNKPGVATTNKIKEKYQLSVGKAANEIFSLFLARINHELNNCKLGLFSKVKYINSQNFKTFRDFFRAEFKKGFIVCADTFDNVTGQFPIGFSVWDINGKKFPKKISFNIIESGKKKVFYSSTGSSINKWIKEFDLYKNTSIGFVCNPAPDFLKTNQPYITVTEGTRHFNYFGFSKENMYEGCIYFTVRLCIEPTWLFDRDQFLSPSKDDYKDDKIFKNDCLIFTLFHGQNRISVKEGKNHWIPFSAQDINAKDSFQSNFMSEFLKGIKFSKEANDVLKAGKELWKYYHSKIINHPTASVDASFYDIREFFQGRSEKGTMKQKSADEIYNKLIKELRQKMAVLAEKIKPKVYEYGFLLE